MKKKIFLLLALCLLMFPLGVFAKEGEGAGNGFDALSFTETLEEEELDVPESYQENSKQITIYMFRGKGCGVCRSFLSFMSSIASEYGDKFKIKTYAINFYGDNHPNNTNLYEAVQTFLNVSSDGVPYIIIGNQVFPGYAASYDSQIKSAIEAAYNSEERYDVFDKMRDAGYVFNEDGTVTSPKKDSNNGGNSVLSIVLSLVFSLISTAIIIMVIYIYNQRLNMRIDAIEELVKKKGSDKND